MEDINSKEHLKELNKVEKQVWRKKTFWMSLPIGASILGLPLCVLISCFSLTTLGNGIMWVTGALTGTLAIAVLLQLHFRNLKKVGLKVVPI